MAILNVATWNPKSRADGVDTYSGPATVPGNFLLLLVSVRSPTASVNITDNGGNVWTLSPTAGGDSVTSTRTYAYYTVSTTSMSVISFAASEAVTTQLQLTEWSGVDTINPIDVISAQVNATSVTPPSCTVTTTRPGTLVAGMLALPVTTRTLVLQGTEYTTSGELKAGQLNTLFAISSRGAAGVTGPEWHVTSGSATGSVALTVALSPGSGANQPPTADAGGNQTVATSSTVVLTGSGTDSDGFIASYSWQQTGGTAVALSDASAQNPSFTAPSAPSTLTFSLTVTDNEGAQSNPGTAVITVIEQSLSSFNDTFTGVNGAAWGPSWSFANGTPGNEPNIQSNRGSFNNTQAKNENWHATLPIFSTINSDQTLFCQYAGAGINETWGLVARWSGTNNYYRLRYINSSGELSLESNNVGTFLVISDQSLNFTNDFYIRLRVENSQLYAKAWLATVAEPQAWNITATNNTHSAAGRCGIHLFAGAGGTVVVDDYQLNVLEYVTSELAGSWGAVPINLTASVSPPTPPPPIPPAAGWETAVASRDYNVVQSWYAANTGHEAIGISEAALVPGSLISQFDGQVFEGIVGSEIRIEHNNVTYRGCRVLDGGLYGVRFVPTFGATVTGSVIEYCTIMRPTPTLEQKHGLILMAGNVENSVTVRHCNIWGWTSSGCRAGNGVTAEYNWVHDFQHPPGLHANSMRLAGVNVNVRRNYLTDGRSGVCSIYFDKEFIANAVMQENILNGSSPGASPSYLVNMKNGDQAPLAYGVKLLGNYFGRQYQFGPIAGGGNVRWGQVGNEKTGNQWFDTGASVAND